MKNLLVATFLILAATTTVKAEEDLIDESEALVEPINVAYYQTHEERQVLIHGAGGCTPNFSTGGCL